MAIYTLDEILKKNNTTVKDIKTVGIIPPTSSTQGGYSFGETMQDIKQTGSNLMNTAKETFAKTQEAKRASRSGEQGMLRGFAQQAGIGLGGVVKATGDLFTGAGKVALSDDGEFAFKKGLSDTVSPVVKTVMENDFVKSMGDKYNALDDAQKRDIDAVLGLGSFLTELSGGGLVKKPIQTAVKTTMNVADDVIRAGVNATGDVVQKVIPAIESGVSAVKTTGSALKMAGEGLTNIPNRVATNVAEKQAFEQSIKLLPTKNAQQAVHEGVDLNDVRFFSEIPKGQKSPVKKLVQAVQDFETGVSKTDPIEAVGKPLISRMNEARGLQSKVGQQLGEVADTLGEVLPDEAFIPVYDSLRGVRGLEGLRLADDGNLDFANTVLASAETASDRNAIQSIFNEATKAGTGKQKHLLRQELRESLGGKKKGGVQLTGTQENAYEAIRRGISSLLDTKNPAYKKLNAQYAKISEPLSKLSKALREGTETDLDILNMKAGLLARRLTSASPTNPEIKSILNAIDKLTVKKGTTRTSLETLQGALNILNKYYDIAPKTGFQNLVTEGVSNAGVKDFITGTLRDIGGKTNATRKKALENALKDLLN